ncbi:hypothetical protein [Streptomyces geranii]|uniref:hypothetical protein n=1 Tax=Streptomyces geranii TaxID=2058923 RepID=UPI001E2A5B5F|nr:hypothetical protein [Streptomyces geranii]
MVDFVVASAKAYSCGSPYFDEETTRALVEQDVARPRDLAATLSTPTLVVHGDHDLPRQLWTTFVPALLQHTGPPPTSTGFVKRTE